MNISTIIEEEIQRYCNFGFSIKEVCNSLTKRIIESEIIFWKEEYETEKTAYDEAGLQAQEGSLVTLKRLISHLESELKSINEN